VNNLQWLYGEDETFREAVKAAGATYIGSTNLNFANTWLMERHHDEDEKRPIWQHADVDETDSREKLEADVRDHINAMRGVEFMYSDCEILFDWVALWLDRQAAITAGAFEFARKLDNEATAFMRKKLEEERAIAKELRSKLDECTSIIEMHKRRCENLLAKLDYAQDERDAYRDLCGRMRKLANELLCMEVD